MSLSLNNLVGFGAGSSASIPTFQSVSTIAAGDGLTPTGTINVNYPASIAAGDLLVMGLGGNDGVGGAMVFQTPSGWTALTAVSGTNGRRTQVMWKTASGSESGTLATTYTNNNSSAAVAQMARYTVTGTITVEASGTAGFTTSTSPAPASITSTDAALAIAVIYWTSNTTITAITGMSGGTWAESAAEQTSSSQSLDFQQASLASASTISGGNATLGASAGWAMTTFAARGG